ncbi:C40 family peptidase [Aneurinibacillus terranovensis]|uniref:C40 family peptidase n=1 Tax=Aneurinibacillus terranovensis TaxID=278991 RepID=UPI000418A763|nr:C40 family peptidase [Aneurinibacillus terranovensis]
MLKRIITTAAVSGVLLAGTVNLAPEVQAATHYHHGHTNHIVHVTHRAATQQTANAKPVQTPASIPGNPSTSGDQVVAYAMQFIGVPYTHGGRSPQTGFDCSGFTSYVYKHFGITISTGPIGQLQQGHQVSRSSMQPGDIVFFHSGAKSGYHEGIYIGNNKIIHAPAPGRNVQITDLNSSWYQSHFAQVRRYL